MFYRPLDKIGAMIEIYPRGIAGFRRYQALLEIEPDVQDAPGAAEAPPLRGDVRFEDVRFDYEPGRPVLGGISFSIRAGETVALVGPSGAGKTTICSLLPRFYDVQGGRISIDGIDIRSVTRASLRRQIGIVEQNVFLFAGTIRENVGYGRLGASDAEIMEAIRRARLDEMVGLLPEGLDTEIGERGARLSGRAAAADCDCPNLFEEPADPDFGRGDVGAGLGDGAGHSGQPGGAVGGADDGGDRAPAGDDPWRRPHPGGERVGRGGGGHACAAAGGRGGVPAAP